VGSQLTFVDLIWWYWLENFTDQDLIDVSKYVNLAKFKSDVESRPNIANYRKSPKRYPLQHIFPRYVLYAYQGSYLAEKALIVAEYAGIKIDYPAFKFGVDNKTPEFLKKNPNGKVPTLECPDGILFESNAIAKYIARKGNDKGLLGINDFETSLIDQWTEWYRSMLESEVNNVNGTIFGFRPYDKEKYDASKAKFALEFGKLNSHLEGKEWIVGNRITITDIILFCSFNIPFQHVFDPEFMKPFPNIQAWSKRCIEQPQFKVILPKFEFATREKQPGELGRK